MKTLLLLRHAKSSWDDPSMEDHERPLNPRGLRSAPLMGRILRRKKLIPELILSSTAVRARVTAELTAKTGGYQGQIELTKQLYAASPEECAAVVRAVPDQFQTVMLVGHNPGLEEFLETLTGKRTHFPTAALARITLPLTHWKDLQPGIKGTLVDLWRPKEIKT